MLKITPALEEKARVRCLLPILRAGRAGILLNPDLCPCVSREGQAFPVSKSPTASSKGTLPLISDQELVYHRVLGSPLPLRGHKLSNGLAGHRILPAIPDHSGLMGSSG